ncbi:unnamed protein product [Cylicostephanus goldi]|uniref:UmuC domain-containing protein n=1 Tax=Cylicostephanus goldi TaxID=71465 RepID=A0A3P6SY90_CYLGO|nr:unnamed protein product [Cylicostephanus goldi]
MVMIGATKMAMIVKRACEVGLTIGAQRRSLRLAVAAQYVEQMRARIRECTQLQCSGGIGNNKVNHVAKLICARHKPRHQTIIPSDHVPVIFSQTPVGDLRMLGGKLGHANKDNLGDLATIPFELLEKHFERKAKWISQLAKGHDDEPVRNNQLSIGVSKNFLGKNALTTVAEVRRIHPVFNLLMDASRFTEGISVQSQNIMGWIEKRTQLKEAG